MYLRNIVVVKNSSTRESRKTTIIDENWCDSLELSVGLLLVGLQVCVGLVAQRKCKSETERNTLKCK